MLSRPQLKRFLNDCIAPVANQALGDHDISAFERMFSAEPAVLTVLTKLTPDFVIRSFFPTEQLSPAQIKFFEKCVFVIRHKDGVYNYMHSSGPRTRYEMKVGFLGLFLWVNYGVAFRIFSTENSEDNIGSWEKIHILSSYQIELLPPQTADLSDINEQLLAISNLASAFQLTPLKEMFQPLVDRRDTENTTLLELHHNIHDCLSSLMENVQKQIDIIMKAIMPMPSFSLDEKPSDTPYTQKLDDMLAATIDYDLFRDDFFSERYEEKHSSESSDSFLMNLADDPLFTGFLPAQDDNRVKDFPDYIHNSEIYKKIFVKKSHGIVLCQSTADCEFRDLEIYKTHFNALIYLRLFLISKQKEEFVAAESQAKPYVGGKPLPLSGTALRTHIYGILAASNSFEIEEIRKDSMSRIRDLITTHIVSQWNFLRDEYHITDEEMSIIFSEKHIAIPHHTIEKFRNKLAYSASLSIKPTVELLKDLIETSKTDPKVGIFLRKFLQTDNATLQDEFSNDFYRICPTTMVIPGIPIKTYEKAWIDKSGIMIIKPSHLAGFKRPAFSDMLKNSDTYLGFPHSVGSLRVQGGKPSYTVADFHRCLRTIHLKHTNAIVDMTRKEFLRDVIYLYCKKNPRANLKMPFELTPLEIECLSGRINQEELEEKKSPSFNTITELRMYCTKRVSCSVEIDNKDIIFYYFSSLRDMLSIAINTKKSLLDVLNTAIENGKQRRMASINNNKYHPGANIPDEYKKLIIAAGRKYRNLDDETVYASNEALLQGIHIKNSRRPSAIIFSPENYTNGELIQQELYRRYGNIVAIFANVSMNDPSSSNVSSKNVSGINQALTNHAFALEVYHQDLPFVTYDKGEFAIYTLETFKALFVSKEDNIITTPVPDQSMVYSLPTTTTSTSTSTSSSMVMSTSILPVCTSLWFNSLQPLPSPPPLPTNAVLSSSPPAWFSVASPVSSTSLPQMQTSITSSSGRQSRTIWIKNRSTMVEKIDSLPSLLSSHLASIGMQGHIDNIKLEIRIIITDTTNNIARELHFTLSATNIQPDKLWEDSLITNNNRHAKRLLSYDKKRNLRQALFGITRKLDKNISTSDRYVLDIKLNTLLLKLGRHTLKRTSSVGGLSLFSQPVRNSTNTSSVFPPSPKRTKPNPTSP